MAKILAIDVLVRTAYPSLGNSLLIPGPIPRPTPFQLCTTVDYLGMAERDGFTIKLGNITQTPAQLSIDLSRLICFSQKQ